jgi:hypothetical protein
VRTSFSGHLYISAILAICAGMPKLILNVSDSQKALWVGAAHDERVSLSEWVRRQCDGGLGAGEVEGLPSSPAAVVSRPVSPSSAPAPSPPFPRSVREFRGPDPKGGSK